MSNKLLYSIREIFDTYVKGKGYLIPAYQRGYKWDRMDIERLLDDISDFDLNDDLNLFYCLQNITLLETKDKFHVVDGQQRLTTTTIILSYLGEYELIKNKIEYKVRQQTENFLNEYIYTKSNIDSISDWDKFMDFCNDKNLDYDYQDIYYIFNAYKTVSNWFKRNEKQKEVMKSKILDSVKLIVNLPKNIEEQELFENLNGKRVPLDGADLIRAIIITRVAKKEFGSLEGSVKQDVLINERRIRIGLSLDEINMWWTNKNRQAYFKYFVKDCKISDNNVRFQEEKYPINFLYKLYALIYNKGKLNMDLFESKTMDDGFLEELFILQRTIENWYNDKELYHLILFTALYTNVNELGEKDNLSFSKAYSLWNGSSKMKFVRNMKKRISETGIFNELINQSDYTYDKHENEAFSENYFENGKLSEVSILLDIVINLSNSSNDKLPAIYFDKHEEDLEHIFPQTPIGDKIKNEEKQNQVLKQYLGIINTLEKDKPIEIPDETIDWQNQNWKENTRNLINSKLSKLIPINSLGNMCLLHLSVNRGYGNDFFLEKRIDIMTKSQMGYYIRPHAYQAFNKAFINRENENINMNMMKAWDKDDIIKRRQFIIMQISKFLNNDEK